MVDEMTKASSSGPVYNAWAATVSSTNNCYNLESVDEATDKATATVGPYVKEEAPEWTLDVVYFDNSKQSGEKFIFTVGATVFPKRHIK